MANALKQGIDYFSLSVDFLDDVKIRKIMRACGAQSIAVLISLLGRIYRFEGYYMLWDEDARFLVADQVGAKESFVQEVVLKAVDVGFFHVDIFFEKNILTSNGIQKRFFDATSRRKAVYYDATLVPNFQNVNKNAINVDINTQNVDINRQSKVKESKVKESDGVDNIIGQWNTICDKKISNLSSNFRHRLSELIDKYSYDVVLSCVDRVSKSKWLIKNVSLSMFFNKFEDILAGKYDDFESVSGKESGGNKNKFNNFEQRTDDKSAEELEAMFAAKRDAYIEPMKGVGGKDEK